jgi:hypothetical protein
MLRYGSRSFNFKVLKTEKIIFLLSNSLLNGTIDAF